EAVVDVGAQRVQRHASLAIELGPGHLRAAEPPRALYADALHPRALQRGLHALAHRPPEADPVRQLLGHALGHQLCVALGVFHLEDVQLHLLAGELLQLAAQPLGLSPPTPDHDAGTGGVDVDADAITRAFDLDLGDAGPFHPLAHEAADRDVFLDVRRV